MFVVTGVTGHTGSVVADTLLAQGAQVRVVVRRAEAGEPWKRRGCDVAVADVLDVAAMSRALHGATAAYLLNPPAYDVDLLERSRAVSEALARAVEAAKPGRGVVLSSVGAHLPSGTGNILTAYILEQALQGAGVPMIFVRAAWFMENWAAGFATATQDGVLPTFLSPTSRALPMVATRDIGRVCAEAMTNPTSGSGVIELEGPRDYSSEDVAAAFGRALGRSVTCAEVPEAAWDEALASWHMHPAATAAWKEMLRGFNSQRIGFERTGHRAVRGAVTIDDFAAQLAAR